MPHEETCNALSMIQLRADMIEEDLGASSIAEDSPQCSTEPPLETRENIHDLPIDSSSLRHVDTIRKSFEQGSRGSPKSFMFGEDFRKRRSQDRMGEKVKLREAREAIHGFSEVMIAKKKNLGEIDSSPLAKTFTFEGQARDVGGSQDQEEPKPVDSRYKTAIFVIHQTHGMLLLRQREDASSIEIPSGSIEEIEISRAALKSSHYKMQLQIAARQAACRHLHEQTGMDARCDLERLQPAVLYLEPPLGSDGIKLLRNELNDRLYYFFRVSAEDFGDRINAVHCGRTLSEPLEGSDTVSATLSAVTDLDSFVFINEPTKALELLESHGECDSAVALQMVIEESRSTPAVGLNGTGAQEPELLFQPPEAIEESQYKQKNHKRKKFRGTKCLCSAMLCIRKR